MCVFYTVYTFKYTLHTHINYVNTNFYFGCNKSRLIDYIYIINYKL